MKYKNKEIAICCPSYKRPYVETLKYLPFCKIYVAPEEYENYLEFNPKYKDNIVKCPKGIQGNVSRIRNYILDTEFGNGADIVCIVDDDLKAIEHFEMLQKKWGSNIVRLDTSNKGRSKKNRKYIDYNPIIKIPIKGI